MKPGSGGHGGLRDGLAPLARGGAIAAIIGLLICALGGLLDVHRAAVAYLVAYAAAIGVVLGALVLLLIAQLTAATWFVVLRRPAESVVAALPALAVLVVPLLLAAPVLYPWVAAPHLAPRATYLALPFFVLRTIGYLAIWVALGEAFRRTSLRQDADPSPAVARCLRVLSAGGLVALALTISLAAIDWLMSLTPAWYSTIYGVYFYAGGQVGALGLLGILARARHHAAEPGVSAAHVGALARLLLTFVLLWVYLAYSQLIVIWSGNLPSEVTWYLPRLRGTWRWLGAVLLAGHFAIPFVLLLFRRVRQRAGAIGALGGWLLLMHYLDCYWLVVPSVAAIAVPAWWLSAGAVLLVGGASVAVATWRARGVAALPAGDARLAASLRYAGH